VQPTPYELAVNIDLDEMNLKNRERSMKLNAIGTMLEKAVIKDPHKPLNFEQ